MSRIYFHAKHRTAEVGGSERAYFAGLASDLTLALLRLDAYRDVEWVRSITVGAPDYIAEALAKPAPDVMVDRDGYFAWARWVQSWTGWVRLGWDGGRLRVDDSSDMSLVDIRAKARRLHQKHGLGLVIVDYLQLLRPTSNTESRVQQVGEMSRGLKILAGDLGVPVIALSQLSRAVEQRTDKKPILSDLRDSGNVEQDADVVMFLYREEYYDKDTERQGLADFIVAKHRNGGLGEAELVFLSEYPKFLTRAKEHSA